MIRLPVDGPVLVVAPHPDDETLGCGGLIASHMMSGQRLHVAFITDGGASHPNSELWSRARLAECREAEAQEALRLLGAADCECSFLRLPDADMPAPDSAAYLTARRQLTAIVLDLSPQLVVLPWRRDPHRDHRDAWALVTDCLAASDLEPETLEYAIWLDELGGPGDHPHAGEMERVNFDISEYLDLKRHAVGAHQSQLGALINDDPAAFALSQHTIERLTGPEEIYWRPCAGR